MHYAVTPDIVMSNRHMFLVQEPCSQHIKLRQKMTLTLTNFTVNKGDHFVQDMIGRLAVSEVIHR